MQYTTRNESGKARIQLPGPRSLTNMEASSLHRPPVMMMMMMMNSQHPNDDDDDYYDDDDSMTSPQHPVEIEPFGPPTKK